MNNEELIKIEKPNIGWSWIELEKYGLTTWENQSLKSHYKMALQIFNQYIPYFYIPKDNAIHYLIIDDNIYQLLENDVRKQYIVYFSKNILTYAKFSTRTIVKYNDWLTLLPSKISSNLEQNNQINTPRQIPKYEYF